MPIGKGLLQAKIDVATTGDQTIVSGSTGQKIVIYAMWWWSNGVNTVTIKDGAGTNLAGGMLLAASSNPVWPFNTLGEPYFITSAGNAFILNLSANVQLSGRVYYVAV